MSFRHSLRSFVLPVVLVAGLGACSSDDDGGNTGPTISSVDGPDSFTPQGNLLTAQITLKYADAENDSATKVRFRVAELGQDSTQDVQGAQPQAGAIVVVIGLPSNAPKQTYNVTFSLIDGRGAEGNGVAKALTVK